MSLSFFLLFQLTGLIAEEPSLTASQQRTLVLEIRQALKTRAYASSADFSRPERVLKADSLISAEPVAHSAFVRKVNAALAGFGVTHLDLRSPAFVRAYKEGSIVSTGARGVMDTAGFRVLFVTPGSPASEAGLLRWDLIAKVDGKRIESGSDLAGSDGAGRLLTVNRAGMLKQFRIRYRKFKSHVPASVRWLTRDVALLSVNTFTNPTYDRKAIDALFREASLARGVILDLRLNGGGDFDNVGHLMQHFLPAGTHLGTVVYRYHTEEFKRKHPGAPLTLPGLLRSTGERIVVGSGIRPYAGKVVVLASPLTGSGGELSATLLKEVRHSPVVGFKTMGAVLIGDTAVLSYGFNLHYPDGEVISARGTRIEGVGVVPTKRLALHDTMTDRAVEVALSMVQDKRDSKAAPEFEGAEQLLEVRGIASRRIKTSPRLPAGGREARPGLPLQSRLWKQ